MQHVKFALHNQIKEAYDNTDFVECTDMASG